jgi:hypothetical protein
MQTAIASLVYDWFEQHPIIFWLFSHPLISSIIVLVIIFLLWRLLTAIATLVDRTCIWLLQSPLLVGKSLFRWGKRSTSSAEKLVSQMTDSEKLTYILSKLEAIEQQQKLIVQEIAALKSLPETASLSKLKQNQAPTQEKILFEKF